MLHLRVSGSPDQPPIVFLHALATSGWMWGEQTSSLQDFHCIAPDLPGHGHSRTIPWRSLEDTADLIAEIIRTTAGGKAHVVGLSLGSYVGLTLLSRHQDLVTTALLSGINVLPLPNPSLMTAFAYVIAPLAKTSLGARLNARALRIPETYIEEYRQSLRQFSIRSFIAANRDAITFTLPANAATIATPTLIAAGEREHSLIKGSMATLEKTLPNSRTLQVKDTGHGWPAERPDLFTATVRAWCTRREIVSELTAPPA